MPSVLSEHPVATLFPSMDKTDFVALKEDIRQHGVKVPILVHGGQILDGRHRYRACQELGIPCPAVEWHGRDPWTEVQSRNLVRRHLSKDQICAIHLLAREQFPALVLPILKAKREAQQRKAQAKGQPRGKKALLGSRGPKRTVDVVGGLIGVSGTTVKRVDRLARVAPELVHKVAAGELSAKQALREVDSRIRTDRSKTATSEGNGDVTPIEPAVERVRQLLRAESARWPVRHKVAFLQAVERTLRELIEESRESRHSTNPPRTAPRPRRNRSATRS